MKPNKRIASKPSIPSGQYKCPTCHHRFPAPLDKTARLQTPFPFCSERCKLIDLGAWLDAGYRIPAQPDEGSDEVEIEPFDTPEDPL